MLGDDQDSEFAKLAPPPGSGAVYIAVDDVDALHDRAKAAGAEIVYGPAATRTTARATSARATPRANLWSFGTYRP
jgi:predicted enzyme related to lactoylglutathione lyase